MRHIILLGLITLALSVVGCASTNSSEAPAAAPEAASAEAAADAEPQAKAGCCAKAKADGKDCKNGKDENSYEEYKEELQGELADNG